MARRCHHIIFAELSAQLHPLTHAQAQSAPLRSPESDCAHILPHTVTQRCQMLYASPRTILEYLACHGPSATQAEALVLLGRPVPDSWPKCRRRSRLSLLRRLASNRKKSASAPKPTVEVMDRPAADRQGSTVKSRSANASAKLSVRWLQSSASKGLLSGIKD